MKGSLQLQISPVEQEKWFKHYSLSGINQDKAKARQAISHIPQEKKERVQEKTLSLPCWVKEEDSSPGCGRDMGGL